MIIFLFGDSFISFFHLTSETQTEFAWVTLATNDSYALGALVVAFSLRKVNTAHQLAVLITPGVTPTMKERLQTIFDVVQEVNVLDSKDAANLALLSRPELGITFTKLHCWRLTQYEKCVFLDADTFVSIINENRKEEKAKIHLSLLVFKIKMCCQLISGFAKL